MGTAGACWTRCAAAWAATSTSSTAPSSSSPPVTAATSRRSTTEASPAEGAATPQCGPLAGSRRELASGGGQGGPWSAGVHGCALGGQVLLGRLDEQAGDDRTDDEQPRRPGEGSGVALHLRGQTDGGV